ATSDAKLIEKQDGYKRTLDSYFKAEKSKTSSGSEAITDNCPTSRESLTTNLGTSITEAIGWTNMNKMDDATNGHRDSVLVRNAFHENGYGSPPDKMINEMNKDTYFSMYEQLEKTKNFEAFAIVDSFPKADRPKSESGTRHSEAWKMKDLSTSREEDCNKTVNSHSELSRIVPLKPQRSKKSLNKENKVVNPQIQSQSDKSTFGAAGNGQMTKLSSESGRRLDDNTVLQSLELYQQTQVPHQPRSEFAQKELKHCRGSTGEGEWRRGSSLHEDNFPNILEFSSKLPTAPPRTLPLKTQWSRDRPNNIDSSHVHYRTSSQEAAKKKLPVNRQFLPACLSIIGT
ncbi:hypothetical protein AMECASPLE_030550, partial [Ameca splendens]